MSLPGSTWCYASTAGSFTWSWKVHTQFSGDDGGRFSFVFYIWFCTHTSHPIRNFLFRRPALYAVELVNNICRATTTELPPRCVVVVSNYVMSIPWQIYDGGRVLAVKLYPPFLVGLPVSRDARGDLENTAKAVTYRCSVDPTFDDITR